MRSRKIKTSKHKQCKRCKQSRKNIRSTKRNTKISKSYKKRSIKGGKYRFNYNLQLFKEVI